MDVNYIQLYYESRNSRQSLRTALTYAKIKILVKYTQ